MVLRRWPAGLNIREAHAFNTADGFSLDVFVVDGWADPAGDSLEELLGQRLLRMPSPFTGAGGAGHASGAGVAGAAGQPATAALRIPEEGLPQLVVDGGRCAATHLLFVPCGSGAVALLRTACCAFHVTCALCYFGCCLSSLVCLFAAHLQAPGSPAMDDWGIDISQLTALTLFLLLVRLTSAC